MKLEKLEKEDGPRLKDIWLRATKMDAAMLGTSHEKAKSIPDEDLTYWLKQKGNATFVIKENGRDIAQTTVLIRNKKFPTAVEALWAICWIEPDFRGQGLFLQLYNAVFDWIEKHETQCDYVTAAHHIDNKIMEQKLTKLGFVFVTEKNEEWSDGTWQTLKLYRKTLNN